MSKGRGFRRTKGRERATPHKLALSVLLHTYVKPTEERGSGLQLSFIQVHGLQKFLVKAIKGVDAHTVVEPVLVETCREIREEVDDGQVIATQLDDTLRRIQTPDDLFDLVEQLRVTLFDSSNRSTLESDNSGRPVYIDRACIFGVFLRRVFLSVGSSFEALSRLFHELQLYCQAESSIAQAPPFGGEDENAAKNEQQKESVRFQSFLSRRQLQRQLHQKAQEIESQIGMVPPGQVEEEIEKLLHVSPDLPRAHFLRYLNCLHHREYQGAVDSLHTYFDYCTRLGGPNSLAAAKSRAGANGGEVDAAGGAASRHMPMMQYAVLNLAALHFQFGHRYEAMLAIQETVRVAQQNGDHVCVAFALAWLFRLAIGNGDQNARQLLDRSLDRAQALGLHGVQGLTLLVVAQLKLLEISKGPTAMPPEAISFNACSVPTPPPMSVLETIRRGVVTASQGVATYVSSAPSVNSHAQRQLNSVGGNMEKLAKGKASSPALETPSLYLTSAMDTMGRALMLQSVSWELFGHTSLSWLSSLAYLQFFGRANGRATHSCISLAALAAAQVNRGDLGHLCPSFDVKERRRHRRWPSAFYPALLLLYNAKKTYASKYNNVIILALCFILQKRAVARGDVKESLALSGLLSALSPPRQSVMGIGGDMTGEGFHLDAQTQRLETLRGMGRLVEVHRLARRLVSHCVLEKLSARQMNLEVLIAETFQQGGNFVVALPHVIRCLSKTAENQHDTIHANAIVKLACTLFNTGYVDKALDIIRRALPQILAHGSLLLQGEAYVLVAKCNITGKHVRKPLPSRNNVHSSTDRMTSILDAQKALVKAINCFEMAEARKQLHEALYLTARVHDTIAQRMQRLNGDSAQSVAQANHHIVLRNRAAQRFMLERERLMKPVVHAMTYLSNEQQLLEKIQCA